MNVTEIYCDVDDFCQVFLPAWQCTLLPEKPAKRQRTLLKPAFPKQVSYNCLNVLFYTY